MQNSPNSRLFRRLLALSSILFIMLFAGSALAAGSVKWSKRRIKERADNTWKIQLVITLRRTPDVGVIPMKFSFEPIAYYERSKVDGDKIVSRTVPLRYQTPHIESMPVGFQNPGDGKPVRRTRFVFSLTRESGFEAGEYKVKITNARTGQKVGGATVIKLLGDNDVIDRRTISFAAEKPKSKKPPPKLTDVQEGTFRTTGGEVVVDIEEEELDVDEGSASTRAPAAAGPQPIKENPGACGCRAAGTSSGSGGSGGFAAFAVAALAISVARRRRR